MSKETRQYSEAERERIKREMVKKRRWAIVLTAIFYLLLAASIYYSSTPKGDALFASWVTFGIGASVVSYTWLRRCSGCHSRKRHLWMRKSCPHCGVEFY